MSVKVSACFQNHPSVSFFTFPSLPQPPLPRRLYDEDAPAHVGARIAPESSKRIRARARSFSPCSAERALREAFTSPPTLATQSRPLDSGGAWALCVSLFLVSFAPSILLPFLNSLFLSSSRSLSHPLKAPTPRTCQQPEEKRRVRSRVSRFCLARASARSGPSRRVCKLGDQLPAHLLPVALLVPFWPAAVAAASRASRVLLQLTGVVSKCAVGLPAGASEKASLLPAK